MNSVLNNIYLKIEPIERSNMITEDDLEYSDEIQHEDIQICEYVRKGLESGVYNQGRFSVKREEGVYHFQKILKAKYCKAFNDS